MSIPRRRMVRATKPWARTLPSGGVLEVVGRTAIIRDRDSIVVFDQPQSESKRACGHVVYSLRCVDGLLRLERVDAPCQCWQESTGEALL